MASASILKPTDCKDSVKTIRSLLEVAAVHESAPYNFIDTPDQLCSFIDIISDLPTNPPSLYIDLEGENLCRHGTISILQVFVSPKNLTCLIDIRTLGQKAFTVRRGSGLSFKDILQTESIPKVFFDVRNDSDALYKHYQIDLRGIQDLQLMELATRPSARFVNGLGKCIEKDLSLPMSEREQCKMVKEEGLRLFAPERGGSYAVFNDRPLSEVIKLYCVQDVKFLPQLWSRYDNNLSEYTRKKVSLASVARVKESQSTDYQPNGRHKAQAPRGW